MIEGEFSRVSHPETPSFIRRNWQFQPEKLYETNLIAVTGKRLIQIKEKVCLHNCDTLIQEVVPPGIEPGTQGFSVLCSTN